jgi:hypothetical protein
MLKGKVLWIYGKNGPHNEACGVNLVKHGVLVALWVIDMEVCCVMRTCIGSEENVWKTPNGVWKVVDGVLIIVAWSFVFVIVWSEEKLAHIVQYVEKMAHIVHYVEWIWGNVVFWLCCALSMWKCIVWCEHGKGNEQDVEELLTMFWFLLCEVQCFLLVKCFKSMVFFHIRIFLFEISCKLKLKLKSFKCHQKLQKKGG